MENKFDLRKFLKENREPETVKENSAPQADFFMFFDNNDNGAGQNAYVAVPCDPNDLETQIKEAYLETFVVESDDVDIDGVELTFQGFGGEVSGYSDQVDFILFDKAF